MQYVTEKKTSKLPPSITVILLQMIFFTICGFCILLLHLELTIPLFTNLYRTNLELFSLASTIIVFVQGILLSVLIKIANVIAITK